MAAVPSPADLVEESFSSRLGRAGTVFIGLAGLYAVVNAWSTSTRTGLVTAAVVLLALAVAYAVAWRPAVLVAEDAVEVRNVLHDVRVPWDRLQHVDARWALTLETDDGRRVASWAVTSRNRHRDEAGRRGVGGLLAGQDVQSIDRQLGLEHPHGHRAGLRDRVSGGTTALVSERVARRWERRQGHAPGPVVVRWAAVPIALVAGAAVLVVLAVGLA